MKAIVQHHYGAADVLELGDIDKPVAKDREVLIRTRAASVHFGDVVAMTGTPYLVRLMMGLRKPRQVVLGTDVAGTVEAVGSGVTQFKPGDAVFGWCTGAFAEYACAPATQLAVKPANLTFEQAAAVGTSAFTALHGIRDAAQVKPGQRVLVNGASGGVGTFVVQVAKAFGAEVTAVCSTTKVDQARSIGADHVIDYTRQDFTQDAQRYDVIFDGVGNHSLARLRGVLTPTGVLVLSSGTGGRWVGPMGRIIGALLINLFARPRLRSLLSIRKQKDLLVLKELVESGKVTPVIDRTYELGAAPEAVGYLAQGHARAKVVITA